MFASREALGADSPMSEDLLNKVNITKRRIPVLSDLRTEALKERHWKQVLGCFKVTIMLLGTQNLYTFNARVAYKWEGAA